MNDRILDHMWVADQMAKKYYPQLRGKTTYQELRADFLAKIVECDRTFDPSRGLSFEVFCKVQMKLQVKQMVRASGLEHLLARRLAMELLTQTGVEEQPASPLFVIPCKTALQARVVTYLVENPLASSYEVASALHCSVQYVRSVKRNTGRRL